MHRSNTSTRHSIGLQLKIYPGFSSQLWQYIELYVCWEMLTLTGAEGTRESLNSLHGTRRAAHCNSAVMQEWH